MTRIIVPGRASGRVICFRDPINFLGSVEKDTGIVNEDGSGRSIGGKILVFPHGAGSSVGAYTIYSLGERGAAPLAMICRRADLTVASGCAMANIPLVATDEPWYDSLKDGMRVILDTAKSPIVRHA